MNYTAIIQENGRRTSKMDLETNRYNPFTGEGSLSVERLYVSLPDAQLPDMWLPKTMLCQSFVHALIKAGSIETFIRETLKEGYSKELAQGVWSMFNSIRFEHDFEYWAIITALIEPKEGGKEIRFCLNRAQRRLLAKFEHMRIAGVPIRIILLKARQWGGSTLTQIYMAWIQIIHKMNWNSVICAHVESTSRIIKGMYDKLLKAYPSEYLNEGVELELKPYIGSQKTSIIKGINCRVTIGSAEKPDGVRGEHTSMAHLSEVGLWKKTDGKRPEDIVQSVLSGILYIPYSMVVYESTAKGIGNFFHREWLKAIEGKSNFAPVFIAWFDIDYYSLPIENYIAFIKEMSEYEWRLWKEAGVTLEQIAWYRTTLKDMDDWRMKSEYPSFADEAFQSTGSGVFEAEDVNNLMEGCLEPKGRFDVFAKGRNGKEALEGVRMSPNPFGNLFVWEFPDDVTRMTRRYVVSVDIGGRSEKSDWSVITVFDRYFMTDPDGVPEVVAEWYGHTDHDLLAWFAAQISELYGHAILVFESNTLESEGTEGSHGEFILDEIADVYDNLYSRTSAQKIREGLPLRWGFQTNKQTKAVLVDTGIRLLRDDGYIERNVECCYEYRKYEIKPDGTFGAVEGNHDDRVMSRLIGLYVCYDYENYPLPALIVTETSRRPTTRILSTSDF